jgi:hypothetical protein
LPNPVFFRWCPSKKSIYRGGFLGGGGALFRSSLWFIVMWVAGCQRFTFSCTCTICRMVLKSPSPLARLLCRHIGVQLSTPLLPAPYLRVSEVGNGVGLHNLQSLGTLLHVGSRTQLSTGSKKQAASPFLI